MRSQPPAPEGIGNLSLTSQGCLEPTTPGVKNPFPFLCPRDKLRSRPRMNEQGRGPVWGVGGVEASDSQLWGLAMGHDPGRTALLAAASLGRLA